MSVIKNPMLKTMEDARIFSLEKLRNGQFIIAEECDGYFMAHLTAEDLLILAQEIIAFSHS